VGIVVGVAIGEGIVSAIVVSCPESLNSVGSSKLHAVNNVVIKLRIAINLILFFIHLMA
jgi:hypothetical protein